MSAFHIHLEGGLIGSLEKSIFSMLSGKVIPQELSLSM
jgi:hypothetical protein